MSTSDLFSSEPTPADRAAELRALLSGGIHGLQSVAVSARLPWLEVDAPEGLDLNLDGEPLESSSLRFAVKPAALRLHLPERSPLLHHWSGARG